MFCDFLAKGTNTNEEYELVPNTDKESDTSDEYKSQNSAKRKIAPKQTEFQEDRHIKKNKKVSSNLNLQPGNIIPQHWHNTYQPRSHITTKETQVLTNAITKDELIATIPQV